VSTLEFINSSFADMTNKKARGEGKLEVSQSTHHIVPRKV
jgi:hypothetical protein